MEIERLDLKTKGQGPEVIRQGRLLVNRLFALIRTSRTHDIQHPLAQEAAQKVLEVVRNIYHTEREATLAASFGLLKVNDTWLKTSGAGQGLFQFIIDEFKERGIGGLSFGPLLSTQELLTFVSIFNHADFPLLERSLEPSGVTNITLLEPEKALQEEEAERKDIKARSIQAFSKGLHLYRQLLDTCRAKQRLNFRGAKRVVQTMVDIVSRDESVLMALAAFKHYDDYTFKHSMNVCIYAIAFGHQLGLDRNTLAYLGMAGFFHDIGKLLVPKEVLTKPSKLNDEEWEEMKKHVIYGAGYLLNSPKLDELLANNIIVAYEHHLEVSLGGYPSLRKSREVDLFSRIVSIVDGYDALTNGRVYRPQPYTPLAALTMMLERKGSKYDEALLGSFLHLAGVYPVGTVVRLNTGEIALVYRISHRSEDPQRPVVKVFTDAKGQRIGPYIFDLRSRPLSGLQPQGNFAKTIVQTLDSHAYFSSYHEYLDML